MSQDYLIFALAYAGVFYVRLLTVGRIEGSNTAFNRVVNLSYNIGVKNYFYDLT